MPICSYRSDCDILSQEFVYVKLRRLDDNYQEVVITQWYCSYHPVPYFNVWHH